MSDDQFSELESYSKNYEYIKQDILYPNLTVPRRKNAVMLYNTLFKKSGKVSYNCSKCLKPIIRDLAAVYSDECLRREKESKNENN